MGTVIFIPFSAFWLRSSVVSVLISLISDMWVNGPITAACCWGSRASPLCCTTADARRTLHFKIKFSQMNVT
uniref:Uncharacterized protein n=1 Tax=Populus trichocarpa TaxID=3694 RepID=U5G6B0_POPTR